ncbi:hypothetical protein QN375_24840 [Pseudomonas sp. MH9.2]|nr:hypothetical protein [Pseudomonas sp. MH9.2]MEB0120931.1 hypothetical protein [Pseudomonas sp. CCI1.2]
MALLRFIFLLFAFVGILAGTCALVLTVILMLRFPPLLIAVLLACILLRWLLKKAGADTSAKQR